MKAYATLRTMYQKLPLIHLFQSLLSEVRKSRTINSYRLQSEILKNDPKFSDPKTLARFEHQVFSQSGEDGVIREIFRRIGSTNRNFVEFGVETGLENNTHFLLQQGWTGAWIEGSEKYTQKIKDDFHSFIIDGKLRVLNSFITTQNIADLFRKLDVPKELDLLSIDIDGNDYWVWKSLSHWKPRVVILEYNAHFPADMEWSVKLNDSHQWDSYSTYFGASLKSFELLGRQLGYSLVYCNLVGSNAFFVRDDCVASHFPSETSSEYHYSSFKPWLVQRFGYVPSPREGSTSFY